ncbi:hypothetical protein [Hymenobacter metallilatus]|uniref:Uncharacterized protein n=1 Tax=Hymenobacter metallilatus TaxID=2493666 RepID=A0A428JLK0_9BACT|nr:hypothetical protein [Hymenobacter metallilatus]RSK33960.1 hypothetical protein EI290_09650 [Hymenobacter metallilatus]
MGIRALLLTPFQPGVEYFYSTPDRREVSTLGLSVAGGLLLVGRTVGQLSEQGQLTQQGPLVTQKLSLSTTDAAGSLAGAALDLATGPVHALAQDLQGRWWWAGAEFGLSLDVADTPGVELSVSLASQATRKADRVAAALIPGFLNLL